MNNNHVFPTPTLHLVITISFFLIVVPVSHCQDVDDDRYFSKCTIPYPYWCGSSELNLSYPFWGDKRPRNCGREGFEIKCEDNEYSFIEFETQKFRVLSIDYSHPTMTIARDDLWNGYCPGIVSQHTFIDPLLFKYSPNVRQLSFFHQCEENFYSHHPNYFNCLLQDKNISGFYNGPELPLSNLSNTCKTEIKVPVLLAALDDLIETGNLSEVLNKGFEVEYNANETFCPACELSGGKCDPNHLNAGQFLCFCGDEFHKLTCTSDAPSPNDVKGNDYLMLELVGWIVRIRIRIRV
ncbi:hypothetical protein EZV62_023959 [Acer yangbiense]|uniref:non-specific serine/threonine protein kinase n=1 Tax=Acer yangbiense TaxID=1000413 RepID=A0A5C7H411_9ROSI|nr:hypothetical protein EZV62_023959 [Acer yangbiense]